MSKYIGFERNKKPLGPKWEGVLFVAMIIYCAIIFFVLG